MIVPSSDWPGWNTRHFVTGGAGFIGSHLVERLLTLGCQVTIYDNFTAPGRGGWKVPPKREGLEVVCADLLNAESLNKAIEGHQFVWHLGANTDIASGKKEPATDLDNCVVATHNVLEAMRCHRISNILFTSTSAVYGEADRLPTPEDAGPFLPISLYGAGKLACEGFISAYCHLHGIQAWIVRFGNVLGARMGHGVIHDFIAKLRRNPGELEILGDGEQDKNYFLVEDAIDGMFAVIIGSPSPCDVFNLGSDSTVKVNEIARIVIEEMGLEGARLRFTGGRRGWPGDVPRVCFDLGKARAIGWEAKHTSSEAVRIAAKRLLEEV